VYCNGQQCKKIKQSVVFEWICVAGELFIRITKKENASIAKQQVAI
jgi:hypothetical protein